jgi:hypothetical protein
MLWTFDIVKSGESPFSLFSSISALSAVNYQPEYDEKQGFWPRCGGGKNNRK